MPADPRKRQKQLQRKAAKRKDKKHQLVRQQNVGLAERMTAAARYPVLHCWMATSIEDQGIGHVILSREFPGGQVAIAVFLVDRHCLGVKDAYGAVLGRSVYEDKYVRKLKTDMPARSVSPAEARKFLEAAVAYARDLGLPPHADYAKVMGLFGDIEPAAGAPEFEFGQDGKPYFVAGPYDTPAKCRQVLSILTNKLGPDGFHYLLPMSGGDASMVVPEALRHGEQLALGAAGEEGGEGEEEEDSKEEEKEE